MTEPCIATGPHSTAAPTFLRYAIECVMTALAVSLLSALVAAQGSAGVVTRSGLPCPSVPQIGLDSPFFVNDLGDVLVDVSPAGAAFAAASVVVTSNARESSSVGRCRQDPPPALELTCPAPPLSSLPGGDDPGDPCVCPPNPDPTAPLPSPNDQCEIVEIDDGNGGTVEVCSCEISLRPSAFRGVPGLSGRGPVTADPNGGWYQADPRGDGSIVYMHWDANGARRPYFEVRTVQGAISRYQLLATSGNVREYRLVEFVDEHDNATHYRHDTHGRVTAVYRPDGVTEQWNYAPAWAAGWGASYSGVEVSYYDRVNNQAIDGSTYCMVFHATGQGAFRQDRLYRVYHAKTQRLPALAGSPGASEFGVPTAPVAEVHPVFEFSYVGALVSKIEYLTADDVLAGSSESSKQVVAEYEYSVAGDRSRVSREQLPMLGLDRVYTYWVGIGHSSCGPDHPNPTTLLSQPFTQPSTHEPTSLQPRHTARNPAQQPDRSPTATTYASPPHRITRQTTPHHQAVHERAPTPALRQKTRATAAHAESNPDPGSRPAVVFFHRSWDT